MTSSNQLKQVVSTEDIILKIKDKINNPKFVSKIEVARLALQEYEKATKQKIKNALKVLDQRIKKLEIASTRNIDVEIEHFNRGYNQALKDYKILKKSSPIPPVAKVTGILGGSI